MLLDRGCPLDVADSRAGDTVLHLATRAGDNALLAVLLRKGANPDISNKVRPVRANKWQLSILLWITFIRIITESRPMISWSLLDTQRHKAI